MEDNAIINRVGFWSAILTTLSIVVWVFVTAINAFVSLLFWVNLSALFIAPPFIVLMASIHNSVNERGKKLWSQIALAFSIIYAELLVKTIFCK